MRALVTGGAGFIGSHIVDLLVESGAHVAVLDDLSTGRAENVRPGVRLYRARVQDPALDEIIAAERPDVVFHQAAQVSVPASVRDPLADAGANLLGTVNLIEACLRHGAPKIVFASSAAVYGVPASLPIDEEHPVAPLAPYGASKLAAEIYLAMYARTRGLRYTVLRYANVYGPRQDAAGEGGVVAIFADRLRRGEPPVIFGDGEQTRDFVHVRDVAAANLLAAERGDGEVFNVGTGTRVTVNLLWKEFCRVVGKLSRHAAEKPGPSGTAEEGWREVAECSTGAVNPNPDGVRPAEAARGPGSSNPHLLETARPPGLPSLRPPEPVYAPSRPGDIRHSSLSPEKIGRALGWRPEVALAEGLAETIRYCLQNGTEQTLKAGAKV